MGTNEQRAKELAARPYIVFLMLITEGHPYYEGDDYYIAITPELPGCMTDGETIEEATAMALDAREGYILTLLEDGLSVPEPQVIQPGEVVIVDCAGIEVTYGGS